MTAFLGYMKCYGILSGIQRLKQAYNEEGLGQPGSKQSRLFITEK